MKIKFNNDEIKAPDLSRLLMVRYGLRTMINLFIIWSIYVKYSPNKLYLVPSSRQLKTARDCFWYCLSTQNDYEYFKEYHKVIQIVRFYEKKTGFKITVFDYITNNLFERHPEIRYDFWTLIRTGFDIFYYNYSQWHTLMKMGDGKNGYPGYEWKMPLRRDLFFTLLATIHFPENLILGYNNKRKKTEVIADKI